MKKLALFALAATTVGTAFVAPSQAAPGTGPTGAKCRFNSTTDVTREAGWQTGVIAAGPLVTGAPGSIHCKVVVNNGGTHASAWVVHEEGRDTAGVAFFAPRRLNYPATAADDVSLCTSWVPDSGPALYWVSENPSASNGGSTGHWSTNSSDSCGVALSIEPNDPECSIWLAIDSRAGTNIAEIWQDCEGYQPII